MKRRGIAHLAGVLIAAHYLLASSSVAAQARIVPLSGKGGVYPYQQELSKTVVVTDRVNWLYCIDSVQGFVIVGPGSPGTTEIFQVTQTDAGILGFSNSQSGPFAETINVPLTIGPGGTGQSAPFYVLGANLGKSVFSGCSPNRCLINNVSILVYTVEKVELEAIDSPFDNNPNAGGGLRIFPDKKSGDDPADMKKVRVKSTLSIAYPFNSIPVFFKSFDVDDPSSDSDPVDPAGSAGDDNRGTPKSGQLSATQVFADANGVAQVDFTVTMQPGDNFRVAASCYQGYLDQVVVSGANLADGAQILPSRHVQGTDMLTVWRRLHIEVDSMGPVQGNSVEGTVTKARASASKGRTVLTLDALPDSGRFEKGRITIENVGAYPVVASGSSTVTVQGVVAQAAAGQHFVLVDDDDFNDNDGDQLDGDADGATGEDLVQPDRSIVQDSDDPAANVFAPAYVKPTYDLSNPNPKVPFLLNYPGTRKNPVGIAYNGFDNRGTSANMDFWTAYLLGAYQGPVDEDGDGDSTTLWGYGDTTGASIFLETGRPWEEQKYADKAAFVNEAATTAHELGHWFGLADCTAANQDPEGGLMCWPNVRQKGSFSTKDLDLIRRKGLPPVPARAAANAASKTSEAFSVEAYANKQDYVLGEVVRLTVRVTNVSGQTVELPEDPGLQNGLVRLFVEDEGAFREYEWPGVRGDGGSAGFQVGPGRVLETEATILYLDRKGAKHLSPYAFAEAGTYRIKAVVVAGEEVLESQPVTIRVNNPKGADREVWKVLRANPELGYFVQLGAPRTYLRTTEGATLVKTLTSLARNYPNSRQADDILLSLGRYQQVLRVLRPLEEEP